MNTINFILSGKRSPDKKVYLFSKHRVSTIRYERSSEYKLQTHISLPKVIFKAYFKYDRRNDIYRTELSFSDIAEHVKTFNMQTGEYL